MARNPDKSKPIPLIALLLAWLVPGAGHAYLGRTRRAVIIFLTVSATFWAGVAMGGVMTVDHQAERWWFIAEMFTGVHGLIGWHRAQRVYDKVPIDRELEMSSSAEADPSLHQQMLIDAAMQAKGVVLVHPTDTVARAYAGVAGLLNLLCIFDATMLALMGIAGEPVAEGVARREPQPREAP